MVLQNCYRSIKDVPQTQHITRLTRHLRDFSGKLVRSDDLIDAVRLNGAEANALSVTSALTLLRVARVCAARASYASLDENTSMIAPDGTMIGLLSGTVHLHMKQRDITGTY